MSVVERPSPRSQGASSLERALETERAYFEFGAEIEDLDGAVLAWTPSFAHAPAGSVVHRVDRSLTGQAGADWISATERRLGDLRIPLARIYIEGRDDGSDSIMRAAGYAARTEIFFADKLPDPETGLAFLPVLTDEDWARKREFHEQIPESPDGHGNRAADLVDLERLKSANGMQCFLAESDNQVVGVVGAVWGDGMVRIKNVLVHPDHRRQSVATTLLSFVAALGRERGIDEQCVVALAGGTGEKVYRSLGMKVVGSQVEWSKHLGGRRQ